jgi:hypothetical protein
LAPHTQLIIGTFHLLRMRLGFPILCNIPGRPIETLYLAPARPALSRRRNSRTGALPEADATSCRSKARKSNKGSSTNMSVFRSKAEERYAEIQKRDRGIKQELDSATKLRLEKTARLRQLRLAKEAEDAAAKQAGHDIKAAGKGAFKKAPRSAS